MKIEINPKKVLIGFLSIITFLLIANLIGVISKNHFNYDYFLNPLFDFDTERNIPTLYSSVAIIICSILLSIIAIIHKRQNKSFIPWVGLSLIFLFLAIDETAQIHEKLSDPTRASLDTPEEGLLRFAWIIPYGIASLIFLITYLRFLIRLPKKTMKLFILSGGIFVLGAIGFEALGGLPILWSNRTIYGLVLTCEELLEMVGIAFFIYTLISYITNQFGKIKISISN